MAQASSGETPSATLGDAAVTIIATVPATCFNVRLINEGAVAGFFSLDGGTVWHRLSTGTTLPPMNTVGRIVSVKIKRTPAGTDLSGVFASVW